MKRLICLAIALIMIFAAGCGSTATTAAVIAEETPIPENVPEEPAKEFPDTFYVSPMHCGQLQVIDGKLCDKDGNTVQLKGVSTHSLPRVEPFINDQLFYEMRCDWGVNVVRFAMYTEAQDGYMKSDYYKEKNVEIMKKGIDLAIANDMYVMVDWHVLQDCNPLKYKDEAVAFFDMITSEYADCEQVIYEICNEPNGIEWADIKAYAEEVIPVIRSNAPNAIVICGTPDWSSSVDKALADPLEYENIMYTLHFYSATHKEENREKMVQCAEAGLPIFVTEYGVTHSSGGFPRDLESADLWMEAMDELQISSCIWNLSKNGEACCLISSQSKVYSGYTEEDFNETGLWFMDMMSQYKNRVSG